MQGLCTVQEEGPAEFRYLAHFMATQTFLMLGGFTVPLFWLIISSLFSHYPSVQDQ